MCDVHGVKPFVRWPGGEDMSTSLMQKRSNTDHLKYYNKTHNASKINDIPKDASVGTLSLKNIGRSKEKLHGCQGWHRVRQQRHPPHGG